MISVYMLLVATMATDVIYYGKVSEAKRVANAAHKKGVRTAVVAVRVTTDLPTDRPPSVLAAVLCGTQRMTPGIFVFGDYEYYQERRDGGTLGRWFPTPEPEPADLEANEPVDSGPDTERVDTEPADPDPKPAEPNPEPDPEPDPKPDPKPADPLDTIERGPESELGSWASATAFSAGKRASENREALDSMPSFATESLREAWRKGWLSTGAREGHPADLEPEPPAQFYPDP